MDKISIKYCIIACSGTLSLCLSNFFLMEIYSKRSSLGCPAPVFIGTWHIIAFIPGFIHSLFANSRRRRYERNKPQRADSSAQCLYAHNDSLIREPSDVAPFQRSRPPIRALHIDINDENDDDEHAEPTERERERKIASAIQGANEAWPVQLAWGVYYIAGTLVFTSIMAVTVPELVIRVLLGLATAASSKVLAFFLCLLFEDTGLRRPTEVTVT